jgi:hypothetical protein
MTARSLGLCCVLLVTASCGEQELEVRGLLDRVVGETVKLELVEGEPDLSGDVELLDREKRTFKAGALKIGGTGKSKLSFVVPPQIASGPAVAKVGRKTGSETYDVPLQINRLALTASSSGAVELLPLPPKSTLKPSLLKGVDAGGGMITLSPDGGRVVVLAKGEITVHTLGKTPKRITGLQQADGVAMAAIPKGVLICTTSAIVVLKYEPKVVQGSKPFTNCRAVAADSAGTAAVLLHSCDSDSNGSKEDCLTTMKLSGNTVTLGSAISIDTTVSASHVAMRADGKAAVVADTDTLYGFWFGSGGSPTRTSVTQPDWPKGASVEGISRGLSSLGDIFAVADAYTKTVYFVSFDVKVLKKISDLSLKETPSAIAFGRKAELYVASGTTLYTANAQYMNPEAQQVGVSPSNSVSALVVQP